MATTDTSASLFMQALEERAEKEGKIFSDRIDDWLFIGGAYYHKSALFRECKANEVDARIPERYWERAIDADGEPKMRNNKPLLERPSQTIMRRSDLHFDVRAFNPTEPEIFTDVTQDGCFRRCYNTWRGIVEPPVPDEIVDPQFFLDLLNHVYPITGILLLKSFAHTIQRPWESPQIHHVLDGEQGIGKDFLLDIAQWALSRQKLTADITVTDVTAPFQPWLQSICVNVNEFYVQGRPDKQLVNFLKSITTTPPMTISCNDKMEKAVQVTKVHRLYVTTNHGMSFPREKGDRRWVLHRSNATKESTRAVLDPYCGNDLRGFLKRGGYYAVYKMLKEYDLSDYDPKWFDKELMEESDQGVTMYEEDRFLVEVLNEAARRDNITLPWWTDDAPNERDYWPDVVCPPSVRNLAVMRDENWEEEALSFLSPRGGFSSRKWEHRAEALGYIVVREKEGRFTSQLGGADCAVRCSTVWVKKDADVEGEAAKDVGRVKLRNFARKFVRDLNLQFVRDKYNLHDESEENLLKIVAKNAAGES